MKMEGEGVREWSFVVLLCVVRLRYVDSGFRNYVLGFEDLVWLPVVNWDRDGVLQRCKEMS